MARRKRRNKGFRHSGARAISAFTRVFDALWRANPESRAARAEPAALDSGSRNDRGGARLLRVRLAALLAALTGLRLPALLTTLLAALTGLRFRLRLAGILAAALLTTLTALLAARLLTWIVL